MAADLSIGEVARRTGLRTSALRYYEDAGILPKTTRVSGQRRYDADVVKRVDLLRFAQQAGFTLDDIRALELSLECGCVRVEDCSLSPADIPKTAQRRASTRNKCAC